MTEQELAWAQRAVDEMARAKTQMQIEEARGAMSVALFTALVAEARRLRALVESAYREGFEDGEAVDAVQEYGYDDVAWWHSDARKALDAPARP